MKPSPEKHKHDLPRKRSSNATSHLHLLVPVCISRANGSTGYPAFVQLLLQSCDLLQTLCLPDHLFHALSLGSGQFHSDGFICRGAVCGGGDVEGSGLNAHDLGCEGGWFFDGAE